MKKAEDSHVSEEIFEKDIHDPDNEIHHGEEAKGENEIIQVLNGLGDHSEVTWLNQPIAELPVILYDDGFHIYANHHSMEEEGLFTTEHHHIVNAKTHEAPALDLSITNLLVFQIIAAISVFFLFMKVKSSYRKNPKKAPSGLQNAFESLILMIRDSIVYPNIPNKKYAEKLTPYFITLFFFIYAMNFVGLLPGGHTPTGSISVTLALAITAFFVINVNQIRSEGIGHYLAHLTAGAPVYLWPILIPIEVASIFIKPFVLAVRLFANMTAGHLIIFAFFGLILLLKMWAVGAGVSLFIVGVFLLEFLVAFLQAFIFTMLTAIFVGLGMSEHGAEAH